MITFRTVTTNDLELVQDLAYTIWQGHYPGIISHEQIDYMLRKMYNLQQIEKELKSNVRWELVEVNGKAIGFVSFHHEKEENFVKLSKLYILLEYHGKGYGQQALQYVENEAKKTGASKLYLTVNKNNEKAIQAYLRAGFIKERSEVFDIGCDYVMDDYIMAKPLNQ